MYPFLRFDEFFDQKGAYFVEKQIHIDSKMSTIGRIVYRSDRISLTSLTGSKEVTVKVLCSKFPSTGMYVLVHGSLSYYSNEFACSWYNFEGDLDADLFLILNINCWTDLNDEPTASHLEELLYKVNSSVSV